MKKLNKAIGKAKVKTYFDLRIVACECYYNCGGCICYCPTNSVATTVRGTTSVRYQQSALQETLARQ